MKRLLTVIAVALFCAVGEASAAAEDIPTLTEEQVFQRWLRSSAEVQSLKARVGAARWDVVTAKTLPNPSLSLTGNQIITGAPPDSATGLAGEVSWPVPFAGQIPARRRAAEARLTVAESSALAQLWQRASDLQSAMVDTAFADARVTMLTQNLGELERLERIIRARASAGANSEYDVLRVTTSSTTTRAAIAAAETERVEAELRLLAGVADPTLRRVRVTRAELAAFRGPPDENALVKIALERRPDLDLARRSVVASQREAEWQRKDAIPTPNVFAGLYGGARPGALEARAGLSFPMPIFDRNQGEIGRALAEAQSNELLAKALEARITFEVQGAWRAREAARTALEQYRAAALPAAAELLRRAEVTYQAGTFSIAELFDAYRSTWDARLQELDLERSMATAEINVERAAVLVPLAPMN